MCRMVAEHEALEAMVAGHGINSLAHAQMQVTNTLSKYATPA